MRTFLNAFAGLLVAAPLCAAVQLKTVTYEQGGVALEGTLAWDDAATGKRPAALIIHDWMGPSAFTREEAAKIAGLGYVAFAADIYGKGVRPANPQEAGAQAGKFKGDRVLLRARATAGLEVLRNDPRVDGARIAAIGFCFGGTTVLELARTGAPLAGVVSLHGGLDFPDPIAAGTKVPPTLVLHGADDPFVPPAQVLRLEDELRAAKADWQLVAYGGAVHAFAVPAAGSDPAKGAAYNATADRRSWQALTAFLAEVFR